MRNLFILLVSLPLLCFAQFEASMFTTNNQKLIEQAIQNGFVVIEQTYQLEDPITHQRFGRYGNYTFGKGRALGVRVANNVLVNKGILSPWENDSNFERYRTSHIPVISSASIIELNDSSKIEIILTGDSIIPATKSLISVNDSSTVMNGFSIEVFERPTEGWLVWVTSDNPLPEWDGSSTALSIYKKTIDFSPNITEYELNAPQIPNHVWGGVFIVPKQTEIGQLTFNLGGILVKSDDNNWTLEPLTPQKEVIIQQGDELTPLNVQPAKTKGRTKKNKKE